MILRKGLSNFFLWFFLALLLSGISRLVQRLAPPGPLAEFAPGLLDGLTFVCSITAIVLFAIQMRRRT